MNLEEQNKYKTEDKNHNTASTNRSKTASDYTTEKSSVMFQNSQRIARAMHRSRSRLLSHAAYQARKERTAGSLS